MKYKIFDASNTWINTILAREEDIAGFGFHSYEIDTDDAVDVDLDVDLDVETRTESEVALEWRNLELSLTDNASQTPDWPNRDAIMAYRTALRDWPSTEDFPATKPEM